MHSADPLSRLAFAGAVLALSLSPHGARAASPAEAEAEAEKLRKAAIYEDYLATNFADAERKLSQAISQCGGACGPKVRARLHCDLGVVDFALNRKIQGRAELTTAIDTDESVALDPDVSTPEVALAFAELKGGRGHGAPSVPPPAASAQTPAPAPVKEAPEAPETADSSSDTETTAPSDCPPGFPGCKTNEAPSDKDKAQSEEDKAEAKTNWLNISFEEDLLLLDGRTDACAGGTGYTCFNSSGTFYAATPYPHAGDAVNGGLAPATMRVLVGYDRTMTRNIQLGARVGYAFGGGPTRPTAASFLPVHAEARATYWIGSNPIAHAGFRVFGLAAGGVAQVDASLPVNVYDSLDAYKSGQAQHYQAWHKAGLGFAALGGGAMYAFTEGSGLLLELKVMEMFPTPATVPAAQLGYAMGL
ncbi:MAG TPA: hypothetical protein VKU41_00675 [Polyangiaceae bacterium]|nr:hypothetical protein [Polyangiaceae bacterium]